MCYRGGGVGHAYMRTIEDWLWETGWGHDIPEVDVSEPHIAAGGEGQTQQEPTPSEDGSDSEKGSDSDDLHESGDGDSDEDNEEETMEGEFGYSVF